MSERVAIVGSRDFPELDLVREYVAGLAPDAVVISGGARGVDRVAVAAAVARGLEVHEFRANWDRDGKGAGMIRNAKIVELADRVVAFWDGTSKGTLRTIDIAKSTGKPVEAIVRKRV